MADPARLAACAAERESWTVFSSVLFFVLQLELVIASPSAAILIVILVSLALPCRQQRRLYQAPFDLPPVDVAIAKNNKHSPPSPVVVQSHESTRHLTPSFFEHPEFDPSQRQMAVAPKHVASAKELERLFQAMLPDFVERETEQNWKKREGHVIEMRSITMGNSPTDFPVQYAAGMKLHLDSMLKAFKSLRTTFSQQGFRLVQDCANALGPSIDPMVDILLPSLIEMCASTKPSNREHGDASVTAIVKNASTNSRTLHHITPVSRDKNSYPRQFAAGWIKTIINKHGRHCEHNGGLELINKSVRLGLQDAKPEVREAMRETYWTFAQVWPGRAER